jgi:hypothetical protein
MTNLLQRLLGREPKTQPEPYVYTAEQEAEYALSRLMLDPEAYLAYIHDNTDEDGRIDVPLMGTQAHFQAIDLLLKQGGSVQSILLLGAINTLDYTPELLGEVSKLLVQRLTYGYPAAEAMHFQDNQDAAQHAISAFGLMARGWSGTDANGRVYIVDGSNRPSAVGPHWEQRLAEMQSDRT